MGSPDTTPPSPPAAAPEHGLLPWLMVLLGILVIAGFSMHRSAWLDNRWVRSQLCTLGIALEPRDRDWLITDATMQWQRHAHAQSSLLIRGRIKNLLACSQPTPNIVVTLFDDPHTPLTTQLREPQLAIPRRQIPAAAAPIFTIEITQPPAQATHLTLVAKATSH